MLARRALYVVCALALLIAIATAFARREAQHTQAVAPPPSADTGTPAPEATASMPPERVVHARVGEIVTLLVRTPQPDTATMPAIGVSEVSSQDVPAVLQFVPSEPGTYPVLLEDSGAIAGRVVVSAAR